MPFSAWIRERIEKLTDRRRSQRSPAAALVAHYWDGSEPHAREVRDISLSGAYVLTNYGWYDGTIVAMTFQWTTSPQPEGLGKVAPNTILVQSRIVRQDSEGVAVEFMWANKAEQKAMKRFLSKSGVPARGAEPTHVLAQKGQSLVEFALVLPLLFLLIVNVINFGAYLHAWVTLANAVRALGQYNIMDSAYLSYPTPPTSTQLTDLVTAETSTLLNKASVTIKVCNNNQSNTTTPITCKTTDTNSPTNDPEPTKYVSTRVDINYTYQPLIPLWDFPGLNIHATIPTTSMHRTIVMRVVN